MSKVKIHIWHNHDGQIVAIGRSCPKYKFSAIPKKGHFVLETEMDEELLETLYQFDYVDLHKSLFDYFLSKASADLVEAVMSISRQAIASEDIN